MPSQRLVGRSSLVPYTPVGKTWQMDAAERAATVDRLVEGLRPLVDYAGERGVRLGIEPLNRFETSFLNTAEQVMEVVDRLDSPAAGVMLDTFHMNIEEKDPGGSHPPRGRQARAFPCLRQRSGCSGQRSYRLGRNRCCPA